MKVSANAGRFVTALTFAFWVFAMSSLIQCAWAGGTLVVTTTRAGAAPTTAQQSFSDDDIWFDLLHAPSEINMNHLSAGWGIDLQSPRPASAPMRKACYERAVRGAALLNNLPGLDFSYSNTGCNSLDGRFRINDLATDPTTHKPTKLSVDFVQVCADYMQTGSIRFNSSAEGSSPFIDRPYVRDGQVSIFSEPGDIVGAGQIYSFPVSTDQASAFGGSPNSGFRVGGVNPTDGQRPSLLWGLLLNPGPDRPLTAGTYDNAVIFPEYQPYDFGTVSMNMVLEERACADLQGRYVIPYVSYDRVSRLPKDFQILLQQRCSGSNSSLSAQIEMQTNFVNGPLVDDTITLAGFDTTEAWPLVWDCN